MCGFQKYQGAGAGVGGIFIKRNGAPTTTPLCPLILTSFLNVCGGGDNIENETSLFVCIQWQHCMVLSESQRFVISLHFAYGLAQLKKGSGEVGMDVCVHAL